MEKDLEELYQFFQYKPKIYKLKSFKGASVESHNSYSLWTNMVVIKFSQDRHTDYYLFTRRIWNCLKSLIKLNDEGATDHLLHLTGLGCSKHGITLTSGNTVFQGMKRRNYLHALSGLYMMWTFTYAFIL